MRQHITTTKLILRRLSDSDHFTNTQSPSSSRKIDLDCSPPKKVRFCDHFPSLTERSDPLTAVNLKQHTKRTAFADKDACSVKAIWEMAEVSSEVSLCSDNEIYR